MPQLSGLMAGLCDPERIDAMKIRETVRLDHPPETVWPWLVEPARLMRWNERLRRCLPEQPLVAGVRYSTEFGFAGKPATPFWLEVEERIESRRLVLRYRSGPGVTPPVEALERFELVEAGKGGCTLRHQVTIRAEGVPCWARMLIAVISRLGKPSGPHPLIALLAEERN